MTLTVEQNRDIAAIREIGLVRYAAMEARRQLLEEAEAREKAVCEWAAAQGEFYTEARPEYGMEAERVTGPNAYQMAETEYAEKFLPLIQRGYDELYGIKYPLNYCPLYSQFEKPYWDAKKEYQKIAVEFLRVAGYTEQAEQMETAINSYLPPKIAERLDAINAEFIGLNRMEEPA